MTSKWGTRSRMIPGASGAFRSRVMLFLFRAYTFQCTLTPASRQSRSVSPRPGDSTLTTSAPKSASWRLSMLPATSREKSRTRTPRSGPSRPGSKACRGMAIALRRAKGGARSLSRRCVESLRGRVDDHAVDGPRALRGDLALGDVGGHTLRVALAGGCRTPAARRLHADHVAGRQLERDLRGELARPRRVRVQDVLRGPRRPATEEAPGCVARLVGKDGKAGLVAGERVVAAHAEPAAMTSAALRVLDEGVAQDAHGIVGLGLLDGRVLRILEVRLHGVHAVGGEGGAIAARDGLVVGEVLAGRWIDAAEGDVAHAALGSRHHAIGKGGSERLEEEIAELHGDLPARGYRGGMLSVHDGAGPAPDVDEAIEAVVHRDVRVDEALEHVHHARVGLRRGGIGGRLALIVAAGEVHGEAAAVDGDGGHELHGGVGDAVTVHEHVGVEAAVGELRECRPRAPLRIAEELVEVPVQGGRAVLRGQRLDPLRPEPIGRRLGAEVAGDLA